MRGRKRLSEVSANKNRYQQVEVQDIHHFRILREHSFFMVSQYLVSLEEVSLPSEHGIESVPLLHVRLHVPRGQPVIIDQQNDQERD